MKKKLKKIEKNMTPNAKIKYFAHLCIFFAHKIFYFALAPHISLKLYVLKNNYEAL